MKEDNNLQINNLEQSVDYHILCPNYKGMIIEMVHNISDRWILEQIYRCVKNMTKED